MNPRTLAALLVAFVATACASNTKDPNAPPTPPPVAVKAKVEASAQATANLKVEVFGFPAANVSARAEGGGTFDLDTSRTPPVILSGTWTIEQENVPPGAPPPVGFPAPGTAPSDVCAPKPAAEFNPCQPPPPPKPAAAAPPVCRAPPPAAPAPPALCAPPAAPAPDPCQAKVGAAPPVSKCGQPVYVGCSGTVGGNRPTPYGDLDPQIAPGTGWPCSSKAGKVGAAVGCPSGIAAILQGIADLFAGRPF